MAAPKLISDARYEAALKRHYGLMTLAAKSLGVTPQAVGQRVANSERLKQARADAREIVVDKAEENVLDAVTKDKDVGTSKWVLERLGKKRGFGNSVSHGVTDDDLYAMVAALGGDPVKLKAFIEALDAPLTIDVTPKAAG